MGDNQAFHLSIADDDGLVASLSEQVTFPKAKKVLVS